MMRLSMTTTAQLTLFSGVVPWLLVLGFWGMDSTYAFVRPTITTRTIATTTTTTTRLYGLRDELSSLGINVDDVVRKTTNPDEFLSKLQQQFPADDFFKENTQALTSLWKDLASSTSPSSSSSLSFPLDLFSSVGGDVPVVAAAGLAVALTAAIVVASQSGSGSDSSGTTRTAAKGGKRPAKQPKVNPLAIPYDAAARLAYQQWLDAANRNANASAANDNDDDKNKKKNVNPYKYSEEAYQAFEQLYLAQAVAEATLKKRLRDLQAFDNQPLPPPPPPRRITPKKSRTTTTTTTSSSKVPFFFAKDE